MKLVFVDFRIEDEEKFNLEKLGLKVLKCPSNAYTYEAIAGHPDILMHVKDNNSVIINKDCDKSFINTLSDLKIKTFTSENSLGLKYPNNIGLNAVCIGNIFVHNLNYTDPMLLKLYENKKHINVKQGYTKCSTAIVNDKAVITSDVSIAKALTLEGIDVLLLPPGDIELPGLNYGFIGGCTGLIEKGLMAFYGDLNFYNWGRETIDFLKKHKVEPLFLRKGKLIDRGSLLTLNT